MTQIIGRTYPLSLLHVSTWDINLINRLDWHSTPPVHDMPDPGSILIDTSGELMLKVGPFLGTVCRRRPLSKGLPVRPLVSPTE